MRISLILVLLLQSCGLWQSKGEEAIPLDLIAVYDLEIPEPSGLTLAGNSRLFCVSDPEDNRVYEISTQGTVISTLSYRGDDLEGIGFDESDSSLWIVEEGLSELVHLTLSGAELSRWQIDYETSSSNHGFEGISRDINHNEFMIIAQSDPPAILRLDSNKTIIQQLEADFASDLSGICQGRQADEFLLISHKDKICFAWSWTKGVIARYSFDIAQAEGVAYDPLTGKLYLVCDSESKLYIYDLPND